MNDEQMPRLDVGTLVAVAWAAEDTSLLGPVAR
jgi:hypothetical protein